jgi:oxalate decarboxylase
MPHSIQGLGPDGCEFLLVFDDGSFDEDDTFLITDWFKHIPQGVLGKNFGVPANNFMHLPDPNQRYIFKSEAPGPLGPDRLMGAKPVPQTFKHQLMAQDPVRTKGGTVRIADSSVFKASKNIAVALVEIEPGGMRELHWHPNVDEWQYYIEGQARMGVFGAEGAARTFDYRAGDVGYVPFAMGHYIENTGNTPVRFLEMFRSSYYADVSLDQWMALTPPQLLQAHFPLDQTVMDSLHKKKYPVVPA